MQCDDLEVEMPVAPKINELDKALGELRKLTTYNNPRQEYLREIQNNQVLSMININKRYVSNVSIGFRVRPITPQVRYLPYTLPRKEERHRTKSENNDNQESISTVKAVMDETVAISLDEISQLKKAKSLECIVMENNKELDLSNVFKIPEVEIVSDCIEKLKVNE